MRLSGGWSAFYRHGQGQGGARLPRISMTSWRRLVVAGSGWGTGEALERARVRARGGGLVAGRRITTSTAIVMGMRRRAPASWEAGAWTT